MKYYNKGNNSGFTLIELILIIIILGILSISTMPKFMDLKQESRISERKAVVSAVKSGIELYRASKHVSDPAKISYPLILDRETNGPCKKCFSEVLNIPLEDSTWIKVDDSTYRYEDGKNIKTYVYNNTNGVFE